ncbi:ap2-containing protein [Hordeum vulgare]|nr:ap2-containing protein [Hordeum vulgare]
MPPEKLSDSKTSFFGVWAKPSGNHGVEFQCDGYRYWLDTFKYLEVPVGVCDVDAWRFSRPRHEMISPDIRTQAYAEFIGPKNIKIRSIRSMSKPSMSSSKSTRPNNRTMRLRRRRGDIPSTMIPVESDSSDRDHSKEEGECEEEFWEQFKSDDE